MHNAVCAIIRLSDRSSVTFVYCVETAIHILKLVSPLPSVSPTLVSPHEISWRNYNGVSLRRGVECRWDMKKCDF